MKYRTGIGFDVHAFADDRKLIIGGVEIPYEKGLAGHSDADVLLHSITDALLGSGSSMNVASLQHLMPSCPFREGYRTQVLVAAPPCGSCRDLIITVKYSGSGT